MTMKLKTNMFTIFYFSISQLFFQNLKVSFQTTSKGLELLYLKRNSLAFRTFYTAPEYQFTFLGHWNSNYKLIWRAVLHWRTLPVFFVSETENGSRQLLFFDFRRSTYYLKMHWPSGIWVNSTLAKLSGFLWNSEQHSPASQSLAYRDANSSGHLICYNTYRNGLYFLRGKDPSVVVCLKNSICGLSLFPLGREKKLIYQSSTDMSTGSVMCTVGPWLWARWQDRGRGPGDHRRAAAAGTWQTWVFIKKWASYAYWNALFFKLYYLKN